MQRRERSVAQSVPYNLLEAGQSEPPQFSRHRSSDLTGIFPTICKKAALPDMAHLGTCRIQRTQ